MGCGLTLDGCRPPPLLCQSLSSAREWRGSQVESSYVEIRTGRSLTNWDHRRNKLSLGKTNLISYPLQKGRVVRNKDKNKTIFPSLPPRPSYSLTLAFALCLSLLLFLPLPSVKFSSLLNTFSPRCPHPSSVLRSAVGADWNKLCPAQGSPGISSQTPHCQHWHTCTLYSSRIKASWNVPKFCSRISEVLVESKGFPTLLCLTATGFAFTLSIYTQVVVAHSSPDVSAAQGRCCMGLTAQELIFSTAALTVLCLALVAGRVLITHQRSGHCWIMLPQHQHCPTFVPFNTEMGIGKRLGRDTTKRADPNWLKGYSIA